MPGRASRPPLPAPSAASLANGRPISLSKGKKRANNDASIASRVDSASILQAIANTFTPQSAHSTGEPGQTTKKRKTSRKNGASDAAVLAATGMPFMPTLLSMTTTASTSTAVPNQTFDGYLDGYFAGDGMEATTAPPLPDIPVDPELSRPSTSTSARVLSAVEDEPVSLLARRVTADEVVKARATNKEDSTRNALLPAPQSNKVLTERDRGRNARLVASMAGVSNEEILATKWLEAPQLALLRSQAGMIIKQGKFSKAEDILIRFAVQNHQDLHGYTEEEMLALIGQTGKRDATHAELFAHVARTVGQRPVIACYNRVKRMYATEARKGKWTAEEDAKLREAYRQDGPRWGQIASSVGRTAADCRDRHRNISSSNRDWTAWTSAEEAELDRLVRDVAKRESIDIVTTPQPDLPWKTIGEKLGQGCHGRLSCANRWHNVTYRMLIGNGSLSPWNDHDTYMLVQRLREFDYENEDVVPWSSLGTADWAIWSGDNLRRHYARLKRRNGGAAKAATHREAVAILHDLFVANVDVAALPQTDRRNAHGLNELPTVPLSSYGRATRRLVARGRPGAAGDDDEDEEDEEAALLPVGPASVKSQAIIEDSDEEAVDM